MMKKSSIGNMRSLVLCGVMAAAMFWMSGTLLGQGDGAPVQGATAEPTEITLWSMIEAGGRIGYLIILLSLVAVALVIEHVMSIRRHAFIPDALGHSVAEALDHKQYDEARQLCELDSSLLGRVCEAGLGQVGSMFGFFDMQNVMQEASEREISRLYRKLEYLAFIATSAPMFGLLGTVTGMITSFNIIAKTEGGATPSQLATGISEALVTTCMGLVLAIPASFFVSFFRNKIDRHVAETETVVEKLMGRFRQAPNR
jgi:biopolymer transport protein ExbB